MESSSSTEAGGAAVPVPRSSLAWHDEWLAPRKSFVPRIPKGARVDNRLGERIDKIKAALTPAFQSKKLADYKKTLPPKPPAEGLIRWVKKNAWEKD